MTAIPKLETPAHNIQVEVAKASDLVLDWLVSTAAGRDPTLHMESHGQIWRGWWERGPTEYRRMPQYHRDSEASMPLLDEALIGTVPTWGANAGETGPELWRAGNAFEHSKDYIMTGRTRQEAGLRCFAADRLGPFVEVPTLLVNQACHGILKKPAQKLGEVLKDQVFERPRG